MGFDNECIPNIQSLKGEYFCPVCRLLVYPNEALQTQCSHLYCKPCLTYVVRTTQACPYDGYLVTEADSKPILESNKALADTIGNISVHCLFHRSGCTWQGQLTHCASHCSECAFGDSLVLCNRCGVQVVHRQVQEHAQNCTVVQTQAAQPENGQVASGTALHAPLNQNQTVVAPVSTPVSQAQASQASVGSAAQKSTQQVIRATQVATQSTEQWYQQQQYYQQYPGYDPYQQQQYQQYYPYQQQAVQQTQQPGQVYSLQVTGQQQPQPQPQFQRQQQAPTSQTSQQPQQLSQAPPVAQPQLHPPQAASNVQQQIQPAGKPQTLQNQVVHSVPQSQPQVYSQIQTYAHPQTGTQVVSQQGMQMPPYQQTRPQMQPSHPQVQTQPYPQPQAQHHSHPQSHLPTGPAQGQTLSHPNSHTSTHPPPNPTQPRNHAAPLQAQHASAHTVTGYQSHQQPQPLQQTQAGAPRALHMNCIHQQPPNPGQFQGQYSQQPTQMRPPHVPAMMPNQQQPTIVPPQVQTTGAFVAQVPAHPHSQHPGYPVQQPAGMQPVQHTSAQPQGFLGRGPCVQQRPAIMQAPARAHAPVQAYQQNSTQVPIQPNVRPMISHGGGQHPYSQAPGLANAAHLLPTQASTNQLSINQSYPSLPAHGQELLKPSVAYKPPNMEKGKQEQNNVELGSGNLSGVGTAKSSNTEFLEPNPLVAPELPSSSKSRHVGNEDCKENEQRSDKVSCIITKQFAKQVPGSHSVPSSDLGRNQWHHGPPPQHRPSGPLLPQSALESGAAQFLGQPPGQLRPQVPAQMHPSHSVYRDNSLVGQTVAPYGRGPGSVGLPQSLINQGKYSGRPPFASPPPPGTRGGTMGGIRPDFAEGGVNKPQIPNPMEGPRFSGGRQHEVHPSGPIKQRRFGQTSSLHRLQDERINKLSEEHLKPFPTDHGFGRTDYEGDLKKFPRPSHLEGRTPIKFGARGFPPPAPPDEGPHMIGDRLKPAGFHDIQPGRPGYPDFPRPVLGFVHHGSPGRDRRAVPTLGGFPGEIDGNKSHSYPIGKAIQESRFPGLSGHLKRGEFNAHGSDHLIAGPHKHLRVGDAIGQETLPHSRRGDFGPHIVHTRELTGPGASRGHLEMGEPSFPGSYLPPRPFAKPFGREMPGYPHPGEPGFRNSYHLRHAYDDGFVQGEMEPFDNPRKRKPGSIMCRICNVDCETIEGLDMHSQTRDHQKNVFRMVISIKEQNSKKQKVSNNERYVIEGRKNRIASFQGHEKMQ